MNAIILTALPIYAITKLCGGYTASKVPLRPHSQGLCRGFPQEVTALPQLLITLTTTTTYNQDAPKLSDNTNRTPPSSSSHR